MSWRLTLSHHPPEEEGERCVHLPGLPPLCRRRSLLYPLTILVMVGTVALPSVQALAQGPWAPYLLLGLPAPAALIFILEQLRVIPYRPWQIWLTTPLLGAGLGLGFGRYLRSPGDPLFWGMLFLFGFPCVGALIYRRMVEV